MLLMMVRGLYVKSQTTAPPTTQSFHWVVFYVLFIDAHVSVQVPVALSSNKII